MLQETKINFKSWLEPSVVSGQKIRKTIVTVSIGDGELIGAVTQSVHDKDVKVIGQKEALRVAIKSASRLVDKGMRKRIWSQFSGQSRAAKKLLNL